MNELVAQNTELTHEIGYTDEVSWIAPANLTLEQYISIANTFQQIQKSLAYWYGDLLNEGEQRFGEDFAQAIPEIGRASETLLKYKQVAARVPREIRQSSLSWTHSMYVAWIEEDQRGDMLALAANLGLSSRELKEVAKLDYDARYDLMVAAAEGIERDEFMRLVNRFKLGEIDKPKPEKKDDDEEEEEEELPFSDLDEEEEPAEDMRVGLDQDTVTDFWENCEAPLVFLGPREAIWQGLMCRASIDRWGNPLLIWEAVS